MRKQEAIHLHALLVEVARHADRRGELGAGALDDYEALDATPTAVHRSKETHEDAVLVLASAVRRGLGHPADAEPGPRMS